MTNLDSRTAAAPESRSYAAPALSKGLSVLELLAEAATPLSTRIVAERLGRSKNELFRVVHVLLSEGYIRRVPGTDELALTSRLFELGMRSPGARSLTEIASPAMEKLCQATKQSAHLVVILRGETVVLATASGGSDLSVTLKLGYRRVALDSTSGLVLLAFQPLERRRRMLAEAAVIASADAADPGLTRRLDAIRNSGGLIQPSRDVIGVTDIGAPILAIDGSAIAAIVVPYLNRHGIQPRYSEVDAALRNCCQEIAQALN